ncbi:MAG: PAS domain S-box protein, partial [Planctomycetes bacterium]|nr:PAS domain S-box protein [Planctomycetota bacterium]
MKTLLFLCSNDSARSRMACALARARISDPDLRIISAGISPVAEIHPLAVQVLEEIAIDIRNQSPNDINDNMLRESDVVVAFCPEDAKKTNLLLPGHPAYVTWDLMDPAGLDASREKVLEAFRKTRDQLDALVSDFFQHGYFETLLREKQRNELILDNMPEGILVHDTHRTIVFFNKAAERITGYSRKEVIGQDCHTVFPEKFCGGDCRFCEPKPPLSDKQSYSLKAYTKTGEARELRMFVNEIFNEDKELAGLLATFKDITREVTLARRLGEVEKFNGIIGKDKKML